MSDALKYSNKYSNIRNLTRNIEGFLRNKYNLLQIIHNEDPSFIFLAEPWLHLPDAPLALEEFVGQYSFFLNSEDRHDSLLSMVKSCAHGGTLKKHLDPYISVLDPTSSHVFAVAYEKPSN